MQRFEPVHQPVHGGRLYAVVEQSNIPLESWLDLSTGINPNGWQVPAIPETVFSRLPEDEDGLYNAGYQYYGAHNLLPVAGSQAAIQTLPQLRPPCKVGVIDPGYQEHAWCWQAAGHDVFLIQHDEIASAIDQLDVLVLINPNNPTGDNYSKDQLLAWHDILSTKAGWLVVDEAFMDATPDNSLLTFTHEKGLIVLRSLGKFFGLAGLRVGFVFAEDTVLNPLSSRLGPWTIANPSRYVATHALQDIEWQQLMRQSLCQQSARLKALLIDLDLTPNGGTHFFQWLRCRYASKLFNELAQQGILVRYFEQSSSLRFGLPKNDYEFERLQSALTNALSMTRGINLA